MSNYSFKKPQIIQPTPFQQQQNQSLIVLDAELHIKQYYVYMPSKSSTSLDFVLILALHGNYILLEISKVLKVKVTYSESATPLDCVIHISMQLILTYLVSLETYNKVQGL